MLFDHIIEKSVINRGWSSDQKYQVITSDQKRYLLRISSMSRYPSRQHEFMKMAQIAQLELSICKPIEIGVCDAGCYVIHEWIDGQDLSACIGQFSPEEQYALGIKSGKILQAIHGMKVKVQYQFDWAREFNGKLDRRIDGYLSGRIQYNKGDLFIDYIAKFRHLLSNRPIVFQHGDYHLGNMMLNQSGNLVVIDFDRSSYGDPWEEFNRIVWSYQYPFFASGMIDGYFGREIPESFWRLLAFYIVGNSLGALAWAEPYGQAQIQVMVEQAEQILDEYDDMALLVPKWYRPVPSYLFKS